MVNTDLIYDDKGHLIDDLTNKHIKDTPEERVRQKFIKILQADYGYPKANICREVPIKCGAAFLSKATNSAPIRADIVVYHNKEAASKKDQGNILFVVECKQPKVKEGYSQLVSYIFNTSAEGGVWTNGESISVFRTGRNKNVGLEELPYLPRYQANWALDYSIPNKGSLERPNDVRFLLSTCHNKLYGRGMENVDFDLAMDMVRILLAKIHDETSEGEYPRFWITNEEYKTEEGKSKVAQVVQELFHEYAMKFPDVFDEHERIQVGDDCIAEVVGLLKNWRLAGKDDEADTWDLMGEAYEQFTHKNLKKQQGQFFTNRLVVQLMVKILNPNFEDRSLDPAGGSGGFCTAIFRHLRKKILQNDKLCDFQKDSMLKDIKDKVFLVEIAKRLVKIAKCSMLMSGDGQTGMTRGNSLDSYDKLDHWIQARCPKGKPNAPTVIATNPPFAAQKADSMISDRSILQNYTFGHICKKDENGIYSFCEGDDNLVPRQAPEILFLERCLDWLKPGGRLGIVLPKGFLDSVSYEQYRQWLLNNYILNGVITLHKNTFQPDTGVRTCVLFITKPTTIIPNDYTIFMAISQRIGQDSKGNKVFILDERGYSTGKLNHDLDNISDAFEKLRSEGDFTESEFIFKINRKKLTDHLNINPQHYSPKLNLALKQVLEFDNKADWSTTTIGQLESDIKIYIGPRWKSSNIKVDEPSTTEKLTPYLTAAATLEFRRFSMKWINEAKASPAQKLNIDALRVKEGDILITRSGTIGKMVYVTKDLAEKYIITDDLIRIRVKDDNIRAYLVAYFCSKIALSLMLRDEYGTVQQHLQPCHIQELLIPIPDDWSLVADMINAGKQFIASMESMANADCLIKREGIDRLCEKLLDSNT